MLNNSAPVLDLEVSSNYFFLSTRMSDLINHYLSLEKLNQHLEDFPAQLQNPQSRPWKPIAWQQIHSEQLIDLDLILFLDILTGIINTEAPIRGYTQASRQYLEQVSSPLARFVGGVVAENGTFSELGLWEKEERRHAPALIKVYQQLTGEKFSIQKPEVRPYEPTGNPREDLYRHGLHRIITEYGAVCLYLWLMVHTTGALQRVFAELVEDELNHTIKFWAMGVWLFADDDLHSIPRIFTQVLSLPKFTSTKRSQSSQSLLKTFARMIEVLHWQRWGWLHKTEFIALFIKVMIRLLHWHSHLDSQDLQKLFSECQK